MLNQNQVNKLLVNLCPKRKWNTSKKQLMIKASNNNLKGEQIIQMPAKVLLEIDLKIIARV